MDPMAPDKHRPQTFSTKADNMLDAVTLAKAARPHVLRLRRACPLEDLVWQAGLLIEQRRRERPELQGLPAADQRAADQRALWDAWADDLAVQVASRAAAM
jgi:hypothetical protein